MKLYYMFLYFIIYFIIYCIILTPVLQSLEDGGKMQENRLLLQSLTAYIVKENSHIGEEVATAILNALIPMGSEMLAPVSEGIGFAELMVVMATLAGAGSGTGHLSLFRAATGWLQLCQTHLSQKHIAEKLHETTNNGKVSKNRHPLTFWNPLTMLDNRFYFAKVIRKS